MIKINGQQFTSCDREKLVIWHVSVLTVKSRRTSIILSVDMPCFRKIKTKKKVRSLKLVICTKYGEYEQIMQWSLESYVT